MPRALKQSAKLVTFLRNYVDSEFRLIAGEQLRQAATPRQALSQWLAHLGDVPPARGRVLITALRNHTWMEWAAYCACVIRKLGFESTLVYDRHLARSLYSSIGSRGFLSQLRRIPGLELVDLDVEAGKGIAQAKWLRSAEEWAPTAVAYDLHVEEQDIRSNSVRYSAQLRAYGQRTARLAAGLDLYLRDRPFHRAFCFSGLIGESKVLLDVLRSHGVDTVCVEGWAWRPGHMIYNHNAPALEYNVDGWLRSLGTWDAEKEREINAYLHFLDTDSRDGEWLENFYRIQKDRINEILPPDVAAFLEGDEPVFLLAPNVIGDSSMLKRETLFTGQQEWTREVIHWFATRPSLKLIIRAHPAERWVDAKCAIYMGEVARKAAAGLRNMFVIDSSERLNTFSLVPFLRAGLVWLSSAGVDLVVRGVPVLVAAKPKYAALGVVHEPGTKEEYFALLERWADRQERPDKQQIMQGKRYLHMVFKGFSYEAGARDFRAMGCKFGAMPNQDEHDRFYRILVGDEPMPDQEPA